MKLRLHGNALRLRLNQAEVAQFSKTGYVEETFGCVGGASLCYLLEARTKITSPQVVFQNGELRVQVSLTAAQEWFSSDLVGISGEQTLENGKTLSILIEKDFKCLHSDSDDPDAYPNPVATGAPH